MTSNKFSGARMRVAKGFTVAGAALATTAVVCGISTNREHEPPVVPQPTVELANDTKTGMRIVAAPTSTGVRVMAFDRTGEFDRNGRLPENIKSIIVSRQDHPTEEISDVVRGGLGGQILGVDVMCQTGEYVVKLGFRDGTQREVAKFELGEQGVKPVESCVFTSTFKDQTLRFEMN